MRTEKLSDLIADARNRWGSEHDFVVAAYCDNPECSAREFNVKIKIHHADPAPDCIYCPFCGKPPILNDVQRHLTFIPGSLLFDDSSPE